MESNTEEPPNNGQVGDKSFDHCSEVAHTSGVEMHGPYTSSGRTVSPLLGK